MMPAKYDATTKYLIESAPQDWLALCGHDVQSPVRVVDADLSTITTMADKVVLVDAPEPWMAHFEFQSSYESEIGLRLLRYSVLIEYRHQMPVQSILVLLQPESDGPAASGITRRSLPNGTCYDEFRFQTLRVWELPVEELLAGKLWTLPLATISKVAESELTYVIQKIAGRVQEELATEKHDEFWTSTSILMGIRYQFPIIERLIQGVINMRESSVIQAFLQEGREEGREEGIAIEARKAVSVLVRDRFGSVDPALQEYLSSISDVAELEMLMVRATKVANWEELLP